MNQARPFGMPPLELMASHVNKRKASSITSAKSISTCEARAIYSSTGISSPIMNAPRTEDHHLFPALSVFSPAERPCNEIFSLVSFSCQSHDLEIHPGPRRRPIATNEAIMSIYASSPWTLSWSLRPPSFSSLPQQSSRRVYASGLFSPFRSWEPP